MLLCSVFGFAVCFNGLGERTITYNPNYGPEIAAENAAALAAAREANNRQAEQQYEIDLAQQQQAMDAARKQLWDDSVSKIKDEAQQALDKLSEQYTPNLNELNSQQRALQLVATNLNEQKIQSETRNNLLRAKQMFQPKDPWRMLDGKVCCAKDQGWFQFSGNVLEVKANGILLDGEIGHPFENGIPVPKYFVENFPNATYPFADGENINKNMDFVAHLVRLPVKITCHL